MRREKGPLGEGRNGWRSSVESGLSGHCPMIGVSLSPPAGSTGAISRRCLPPPLVGSEPDPVPGSWTLIWRKRIARWANWSSVSNESRRDLGETGAQEGSTRLFQIPAVAVLDAETDGRPSSRPAFSLRYIEGDATWGACTACRAGACTCCIEGA